MDFVPPEKRHEAIPCHHIPLTASGQTVATIDQREDQSDLEEAVKKWLRETIKRLEMEQRR
jgi:hypothetical protein